MKYIILTQYYPPETGAPQNRLHSLAKNLIKLGHAVEVLTAMPNYPKSEVFPMYRGRMYYFEYIEKIPVHRTWIYVSKKPGILRRLLNYFSFVFTSILFSFKLSKADILIVESPPLFLSWSAFIIGKFKGAKVVFNVSDLWPESAEKLGIITNKFFLWLASLLESYSYKKAILVSGQTQGIVQSVSTRFPEVKSCWVPNGIDTDVFENIVTDHSWKKQYSIEDKKVFMYAGIIGHAQSLEVIIKAASGLKQVKDIAFVIIGDGPEKSRLQLLNNELNAGVIFIPNTPKLTVLSWIASSHCFIVPLKRLDLFKGAIPSKLFDPLAVGVPIILGVEGEALELFIKTNCCGWNFEPENEIDLIRVIKEVLINDELVKRYGSSGKEYVNRNFDRSQIASVFHNTIESNYFEKI